MKFTSRKWWRCYCWHYSGLRTKWPS